MGSIITNHVSIHHHLSVLLLYSDMIPIFSCLEYVKVPKNNNNHQATDVLNTAQVVVGPVAMHVAPEPHQVVPKGDGGHVGRIETRH